MEIPPNIPGAIQNAQDFISANSQVLPGDQALQDMITQINSVLTQSGDQVDTSNLTDLFDQFLNLFKDYKRRKAMRENFRKETMRDILSPKESWFKPWYKK